MPPQDRSAGRPRPEAEHVNDLIRSLMAEPATRSRTDRYARLLDEWAEATRDDYREAA
ncbi:hypothetical protein [Streptomyces sp. AMCC400023]|uniref:hypothetical protein n=1 Tax=Streptomyces sp. AMCC400023 TaxID=2056258 RepID=UPI001F39E2F0|nr:hypothetical protein [Streptomyces sp. AMCC400023]